jgi:hypothetical protein
MIPKIIFTYWHSTILPDFVRACIDTWRKNNSDFEIRIYNKAKFSREFPKIPIKYNELNYRHQANYIRLCLIEKYGGIWLDCTVILFGPLSKLFIDTDYVNGFCTPWSDIYFENWCIIAPQNNILITKWKQEYIGAIEMGFDKYKKNYVAMVNNITDSSYRNELKKCFFNLPRLTAYACYKHACMKGALKEAIMLKSSEGPYHFTLKRSYSEAANILFKSKYNEKDLTMPIIKITHFHMPKILENLTNKNLTEKESIIGKYISPYYNNCIIVKTKCTSDDDITRIMSMHNECYDRRMIICICLSMNSFKIFNSTDCCGFDEKSFNDKNDLMIGLPDLVLKNYIYFVEDKGKYLYKNILQKDLNKGVFFNKETKMYMLKNNVSMLMSLFGNNVCVYTEEALNTNIHNSDLLQNHDDKIKSFISKKYNYSFDHMWVIESNVNYNTVKMYKNV